MKLFLLIPFFFSVLTAVPAQQLKYFRGFSNIQSEVVSEVVNPVTPFIDKEHTLVMFSYPVSSFLELSFNFSTYRALTVFWVGQGQQIFFGHGSGRTGLRRLGLSSEITLINFNNKLKLNSLVRIDYESTYNESFGRQMVNSITVSDPPRTYEGQVFVEAFPGNQFLPTAGFNLEYHLFWRIALHAEFHWSFGHRPYQRLYFEYAYQGVEQPTAEWLSDGTMVSHFFGISYKLWGKPEEKKDSIKFLWF